MSNKHELFNFLAVLLFKQRVKHLWIVVIASLLVALLSSFFFLSSSIEQSYLSNIEKQSDFVVQKYRAGKVEDMPVAWRDDFKKIKGVKSVTSRVYGVHFYDPSETYFMVVGVDFSNPSTLSGFQKAFPDIEVKEFLSRENMIIGDGVKELFDFYQYKDYYIFRPPDKGKQKVYFHTVFSKESGIFTNDMVVVDIDLARKILGTKEGMVTDMAIDIESDEVHEDVRISLILSYFDMRIISKEDLIKHYENLYNYKGGVFLALYSFSLITFLLILYQRYTSTLHKDAKEIAILRVCGWKISDVIYLKLYESFFVGLVSYMLGVVLAYFYVYGFDAPLLKEIFLGFKNLNNATTFTPSVEFSSLISVFFLFMIPFILVVLIPAWKISIREPVEVMR